MKPVSTTQTEKTPTEIANEIHADLGKGKSIDTIAQERGMTREAVMTALGGEKAPEIVVTEGQNGDTRVTTITDSQGRAVTENIDYQHGTHYTVTTTPDGDADTSPIRTESEKKQEISYDSETGVTTTTETDDLGSGETHTETSYENGTKVETTVNPDGTTQTFVTGPDGERVELDPKQSAPGLPGDKGTVKTADQNVSDTKNAIENGKTVEEIAQERGLSADQVRAELLAAGVDIKETTSGTTTSITLTDSKTGDETTYTQEVHDNSLPEGVQGPVAPSYTVTTVETKDGATGATNKTVTNSQTGEIRTTKTDENGRITETVTQPGADGKETTTTTVTANGYTMTTGTDGTVTLKDNETGDTITLEKGSAEAALAQSLIEANPNSTDPAEKKEGEVTKAFAESQLADKFLEAQEKAATDATQSKNDAIDEHGIVNPADPDGPKLPGIAATPTERDGVLDPVGDPPKYGIPPGEKWIAYPVNGQWVWMHPDVAAAFQDESIALSQVTETKAQIGSDYADLNRYLLDPDYEQAVEAAQAGINEKFEPLGLQWNAVKPEGTLEDAKQLQTDAHDAHTKAGEAYNAYKEGKTLLDQAINNRVNMGYYPGRNDTVAVAADSNYNFQDEVEKGEAAWAEINDLVAQADVKNKAGDQALADMMALTTGSDTPPPGMLEKNQEPVEITIGDQTIKVAPDIADAYNAAGGGIDALASATSIAVQVNVTQPDGSVRTEWRWVEPQVALFKTQTDGALQLSEAYSTYYSQKSGKADYEVLENQTIAQQRERAPHQFDPDGFTDAGGKFSGKFKSAEVIQNADGQFVLEIKYEDKTLKIDITADPDDKNASDEARNGPLAQQWRDLQANSIPTSNGDQCVANPGPLAGYEQAKINVNTLLDKRVDVNIGEIDKQIEGMEAKVQEAIGQYGPGTAEPPAGLLSDGQPPVEVDLGNGLTVKVAPEVAENLDGLSGLEKINALTNSGKPVWIEISPTQGAPKEGRWVDPRIANLQIQLGMLNQQRDQLDDVKQNIASNVDRSELLLSEPERLGTDDADRVLLDKDEDKTLSGIFQPQFQGLQDNGFDNKFEERAGEKLSDYIGETTGLAGIDDAEARDKIIDEIHNIGGDSPKVKAVPIFYVPESGETSQTTLFAVQDSAGNTKYVDANGQKFDGVKDFQENNRLFDDSGKLVIPKNLEMKEGEDGQIALDVVDARIVSAWDKVIDPVVGLVGTGATLLSFTPLAPVAAPIAIGSGVYLGGRAVIRQADYLDHGGEWGDTESLMNVASVAMTALPVIGSSMRTFGMAARTEMSFGRSLQANFGAMRMKDSTFTLGGRTFNLQASPYAASARSYLNSGRAMNVAALGLEGTAAAIGVPMIAATASDLLTNGDKMSGLEFTNAITGLGTGVVGTGMGVRSFAAMRPVKTGNGEETGTQPPVDATITNAAYRSPLDPDGAGPTGTPDQTPGVKSGKAPTTIQLIDETGQPITATVLGRAPNDPESIYVTAKGGWTPRGDEPQYSNKSHSIVWDGKDAYVVPWIRGASSNHQPSAPRGPSRTQLQATAPRSIDIGQLEPRHVPWLKSNQVAGFTPKQWADFKQAGLQPYLTRNQMRGIPEARVRYIDAGILTQNQIKSLTNSQIAAFTGPQWKTFNKSGSQAYLTKTQFSSLPEKQFKQLDMAGLDGKQVPWMSAKGQVAGMTNGQWKAFNQAGLPEYMTQGQTRAVPTNRMAGLNVSSLKPRQIPWLTQKQWEAFNRAGQQKNLTEPQIRAISLKRVPSLGISGLEPQQFGWLSNAQFSALSTRQVHTMSGPQLRSVPESSVGLIAPRLKTEQLPELTTPQMEAITGTSKQKMSAEHKSMLEELVFARNLTGDEITNMSPMGWKSLNEHQWQALTGDQLRAIPEKRVKHIDLGALKPEQLPEFTTGQSRRFTPGQMAGLSKEQLGAFTSTQNAIFRPIQTAAIKPDLRAALNGYKPASRPVQAIARMRAAGVGDFVLTGVGTGTFAIVMPLLPANAQLAIHASSYGARAATQVLLALPIKQMDVSHPFGRTVRAITALSFMPNQAYGGIPATIEAPLSSNTLFTVSNVAFGTKALREARTGQSAFTKTDKYHLPSYLVGSGLSIPEGDYAPLNTTAGVLFGVGSGWLWGKQHPKMGKAGWGGDLTTADRWMFGVTFGGGLAIYSFNAFAKLFGDDEDNSIPAVDTKTEPSGEPPEIEQPEKQPEENPEPETQLVVIAPDGLNVREAPGVDSKKLATLHPGSLVDETGERHTDKAGNQWALVDGFATDGTDRTGWVLADYVDIHPSGDQDSQGRFNPDLDQQGYTAIVVDTGDNIVIIAKTNNRDVSETVALNLGHITDPSLIFKGDRVYLPLQAVG
ncbi:DUF4781 domain-containing protein [Ochrobactrum vermis]|uniref:DUF4781 domain-containing protein n=1 Tax=Ochrobactrum vermis TaxID=1827297 RepID=UPI0015E2A65F|nr:SH3 domain-containing protein [Ochrobactrum vermis]